MSAQILLNKKFMLRFLIFYQNLQISRNKYEIKTKYGRLQHYLVTYVYWYLFTFFLQFYLF